MELVNKERSKAGLNALSIDENIETAAMVRSKEIEKSFSHTRPNGSSFSTALSENGVKFMGAGENIAWGQRSPEEVMNGWMNSSGHRANILNSSFKKIGVAYYVGANGRTYWTQLFTY
ncbi:CAP domain-containing protein [Eubacterium sp. AF15-50]|nr:CAP domain-containing protein [Eubacterium sp. AF16-48]RHR78251.1 CAP domain-containing protein [Eubacterium sp. AF15-50]